MSGKRTGALVFVVAATALLARSAAARRDAPPGGEQVLLRWLSAGRYRERFVGEPDVRPSVGDGRAHGANVRSWYGPVLVEDLRAGRTTFRKGAAMVKELYFGDRTRVIGYSVMTKIRRRSGATGRGWLFYETLDGTSRGAAFGRGLGVCTGCHRSGVDFLRSEFRP